eukprot:3058815-Pyramimonas_sp.AAC.1
MISVQSALTSGDSVLTKFPLTALFDEYIKEADVRYNFNAEVARFVDYELSVLETGIKPDRTFYGVQRPDAGQPLCGPFWFVYAGTRADGKARRYENAFERNSASTFVCIDCAAAQPYAGGPAQLCYADCTSRAGL